MGDFLIFTAILAILFWKKKPKIEQDFGQFTNWHHFLPMGSHYDLNMVDILPKLSLYTVY